jgi:hypothetical protein
MGAVRTPGQQAIQSRPIVREREMKFEALESLGRYSEVFRASNFSFGDCNLYSSEAQEFI